MITDFNEAEIKEYAEKYTIKDRSRLYISYKEA